MGLDQYLYRKHNVYGEFKHIDAQGEVNINYIDLNKKRRTLKLHAKQVSSITEQVLYLRKANQIHGYLTKNFGQDIFINLSGKEIKELVNTCKQVIDFLKPKKQNIEIRKDAFGERYEYYTFSDTSLAKELLPPTKGPFFGSQEIDKWYFDDLIKTYETLSKLEIRDNDIFVYEASY